MTRIITAIIGIPLVILIIRYVPVIYFNAILLIVMLLALSEYFSMMKKYIPLLFRWPGYLLACAIFLCFYFYSVAELPLLVLSGCMLLILTIALFSRLDMEAATFASVFTFFGVCYVAGLMGFMVAIRMIDGGGETGSDFILMLFCILWAGDSFAYLAGRSLGRRKLAPVVSPKKTVEGAIAGFIFSIFTAIVCRYVFLKEITVVDAIWLGAIVGTLGQIGDLCESILKRSVHIKDSGGIVPGHGGMLDRLDSLLFGAPGLYYYWYLFLRA